MKNRFGNVTYDSTLSQGLYPAQQLDTISHEFGLSFQFQDGLTATSHLSTSLPQVQSYNYIQVVHYVQSSAESSVSSALPLIMDYSYIDVSNPVAREATDSVSTSLPTMQSYSYIAVVVTHTLFDAVLSRPEDTIATTYSLEFTLL